MSQIVELNSLRQLNKKYSSCPNIPLKHDFVVEKSSSIRKTASLKNMAFGNYEFATKSTHPSVIATKEACVQEEVGVRGDSLAAVKTTIEEACVQEDLKIENDRLAVRKEKPKRRSLCKSMKRFFRRMFCCGA